MTALLAVEFEPDTNTYVALSTLRRPGLVITSLDVSARDAVASVEVADAETLREAMKAVCNCACVRSGVAFPNEA